MGPRRNKLKRKTAASRGGEGCLQWGPGQEVLSVDSQQELISDYPCNSLATGVILEK